MMTINRKPNFLLFQVPGEVCWPLEGDSLCTKMLTIQCDTEKFVSGWRCTQLKLKHVCVHGAVLAPTSRGGGRSVGICKG